MSLEINIPDNYVPKFKEIYLSIYEDFLDRLVLFQKEWDELHPILDRLGILAETHTEALKSKSLKDLLNHKKLPEKNKIKYGGVMEKEYDTNWTWVKKASFILVQANKALTSKEIAEILVKKYEPNLNLETVINSVPATLSVAARDGKWVRRFQNENEEYVYDVL